MSDRYNQVEQVLLDNRAFGDELAHLLAHDLKQPQQVIELALYRVSLSTGKLPGDIALTLHEFWLALSEDEAEE
jgi:hypothetical protein